MEQYHCLKCNYKFDLSNYYEKCECPRKNLTGYSDYIGGNSSVLKLTIGDHILSLLTLNFKENVSYISFDGFTSIKFNFIIPPSKIEKILLDYNNYINYI